MKRTSLLVRDVACAGAWIARPKTENRTIGNSREVILSSSLFDSVKVEAQVGIPLSGAIAFYNLLTALVALIFGL